MEINIQINPERTINVDGMMSFDKTDSGLNVLEFMATELVEVPASISTCKVQAMRDGNVYITEKPKRVRNTPIFREDNCTFSLGHDDRYYFVFTMEKGQVKQLPDRLVHQALAIAQKVERTILNSKGRKGLVEKKSIVK